MGENRGEVGRSTESVAGLMNESFRSGKPAERTDGRTELREEIHARTHTGLSRDESSLYVYRDQFGT